MPGEKAEEVQCAGCALRDRQIATLEGLVNVYQQDDQRRKQRDAAVGALVGQANQLQAEIEQGSGSEEVTTDEQIDSSSKAEGE